MPAQQNPEAGFTLVEVLIALTLLAVALLGIAGLQLTAIKANSAANQQTTTTAIAAGILDEILSWPQSAAKLKNNGTYSWDFDPNTLGVQSSTIFTGGGTYTAKYSVSINYDAGFGGLTNLTRIEVQVDQSNKPQHRAVLVGFKRRS